MSFSLSSVISSINIDSALPSLLETTVCSHIEESFFQLFKFGHLFLAEHINAIAGSVAYSDEVFLLLMTLIQKQLLWSVNSSLCELCMGLCRKNVAERPRSYYEKWRGKQILLPFRFFGPPPSFSAEERAFSTQALKKASSSSTEGMEESSLLRSSGALEEMNVMEAMEADRSLYGHLKYTRLSVLQKIVSLFLLTFMPYLKRRAGRWYDEQVDPSIDAMERRAALARQDPRRARIYAFLAKHVYPFFHVLLEGSHFLFDLFYILELTPYSSPFHRFFRIAVTRLNASDGRYFSKGAFRTLFFLRIIVLLIFYGSLLIEATRYVTQSGGAAGGDLRNAVSDLPIPPAPVFSVDTNFNSADVLPSPGVCPVCKKPIVNSAVVTVSGVLGCYVCLQEYIHEHKMCPVTKQSASVMQLRRIVTVE